MYLRIQPVDSARISVHHFDQHVATIAAVDVREPDSDGVPLVRISPGDDSSIKLSFNGEEPVSVAAVGMDPEYLPAQPGATDDADSSAGA